MQTHSVGFALFANYPFEGFQIKKNIGILGNKMSISHADLVLT